MRRHPTTSPASSPSSPASSAPPRPQARPSSTSSPTAAAAGAGTARRTRTPQHQPGAPARGDDRTARRVRQRARPTDPAPGPVQHRGHASCPGPRSPTKTARTASAETRITTRTRPAESHRRAPAALLDKPAAAGRPARTRRPGTSAPAASRSQRQAHKPATRRIHPERPSPHTSLPRTPNAQASPGRYAVARTTRPGTAPTHRPAEPRGPASQDPPRPPAAGRRHQQHQDRPAPSAHQQPDETKDPPPGRDHPARPPSSRTSRNPPWRRGPQTRPPPGPPRQTATAPGLPPRKPAPGRPN